MVQIGRFFTTIVRSIFFLTYNENFIKSKYFQKPKCERFEHRIFYKESLWFGIESCVKMFEKIPRTRLSNDSISNHVSIMYYVSQIEAKKRAPTIIYGISSS